MAEPKVCICIPSYNNERTIAETLSSILSGIFTNFIIKVVDDHSTDSTQDIVRSFMAKDSRVQLIVNAQNLGLEENFNRCIEYGEGDFLGIFHADDVYSEQMLREQVRALEADPSLLGVFAHARLIDARGKQIGYKFLPDEFFDRKIVVLEKGQLLFQVLKYSNFLVCPSALLRLEAYKQIIKKFKGSQFRSSLDLDAWLRLNEVGRIGLLTEPLMSYRDSESSWSTRDKRVRVGSHHLFFVLEHHIKKSNETSAIPAEAQQFYEFLKFKDCMIRSFNAVKLWRLGDIPDAEFKLSDALRVSMKTNYQRHFGPRALALWPLRGLGLVLRKIGFGVPTQNQ